MLDGLLLLALVLPLSTESKGRLLVVRLCVGDVASPCAGTHDGGDTTGATTVAASLVVASSVVAWTEVVSTEALTKVASTEVASTEVAPKVQRRQQPVAAS